MKAGMQREKCESTKRKMRVGKSERNEECETWRW